jgi:flagellin
MSFALNTNAASMNIVANLALSQTEMHKAMERVSSGLRVVNAADDAAGMSLHVSLKAQISGMQAAVRNGQDGISLSQTADGALAEIGDLLSRAYQVALNKESTATLSGGSATNAGTELTAIAAAIAFIKANTYWGDTSNTAVGNTGVVAASVTGTVTLNTADSSSAITSSSGSSAVFTAIQAVASSRAIIGTNQEKLEAIVRSNTVAISNLQASDSRIADADMALEISNVTRLSILGQAGSAMLAQANKQNQNVLQLLQ